MPDVNLHSFTGPEFNNQVVDWSDKTLIDGTGYTDTLKFTSKLKNFNGKFPNVRGGAEDCADFNNEVDNVQVVAETWQSGGKYISTIKGGANRVHIGGKIIKHGSSVDVELGNWSDQSKERTTNTEIDLTSADGGPVTVRVLKSDPPTLVPGSGPYKFLFPSPNLPGHGIIVALYFFFLGLYKKFGGKG